MSDGGTLPPAGHHPPRPVPDRSTYGAPYWDAARAHRLVLQRCTGCGRLQHFPRPWCTQCLADDLEFVAASGRGTIYSFTVVRRNRNPVFAPRTPYVIALVDLDEGVRVFTGIVDCDPDAVSVGQRVRVCFEDVDDDHSVPLFRLDPEGE